MIKLVFCVRKLAHLEDVEFHRYWWEEHGPLVRSHAATLGIRRYVQTHTLDSPINAAMRAGRGALEPFDGVAELWWDSAEAMSAASGTDEGREAGRTLLEDERRFIDLARSALWVAEERPVVEASS